MRMVLFCKLVCNYCSSGSIQFSDCKSTLTSLQLSTSLKYPKQALISDVYFPLSLVIIQRQKVSYVIYSLVVNIEYLIRLFLLKVSTQILSLLFPIISVETKHQLHYFKVFSNSCYRTKCATCGSGFQNYQVRRSIEKIYTVRNYEQKNLKTSQNIFAVYKYMFAVNYFISSLLYRSLHELNTMELSSLVRNISCTLNKQ